MMRQEKKQQKGFSRTEFILEELIDSLLPTHTPILLLARSHQTGTRGILAVPETTQLVILMQPSMRFNATGKRRSAAVPPPSLALFFPSMLTPSLLVTGAFSV